MVVCDSSCGEGGGYSDSKVGGGGDIDHGGRREGRVSKLRKDRTNWSLSKRVDHPSCEMAIYIPNRPGQCSKLILTHSLARSLEEK